jgi:broad specificity phosphatase PhoE
LHFPEVRAAARQRKIDMLTPGKQLILVKHSLPEIEEHRPAREWKLSEQGRARARQLAERLKDFQPDVIVCSSEPKAKETADIVAKAHRLELQVVSNLHEHDRSNVPYQAQGEFQASVREFFQRRDVLVYGQETADQAHARFQQAMLSVLNAYANRTVLVVTHGTVISLFVSRRVGISDFALWGELGCPSFVVIDLQSNLLLARENIVGGKYDGIH